MKTNLDRKIEDYGDAIDYLADLVVNNEVYHPDDPLSEIIFEFDPESGIEYGISDEDVKKMDNLMEEVFKHVDNPYEIISLFLRLMERIYIAEVKGLKK